ncbi:hypothetical protein [Pseudomonas sp. PS02290]|uniref:hypothetical protein n=1 Tax=Pseudomonas sp. PS02290 TaxID=2991430 RepID=UPI00249CB986|nr:hypothetical protein [Pseudomonas sp. PS02290]
MQLDIAAIKGGFPEGVWLDAVSGFRLQRGYLTVVFQDGDGFRSTEVQMSGSDPASLLLMRISGRHPYQWRKISIRNRTAPRSTTA